MVADLGAGTTHLMSHRCAESSAAMTSCKNNAFPDRIPPPGIPLPARRGCHRLGGLDPGRGPEDVVVAFFTITVPTGKGNVPSVAARSPVEFT